LDSSLLVPGDLVDISESSLTTFPADFVLLSGDAIVNESMLTGESVPVSKVPIEADGVIMVSTAGAEIPAELSRHIVFSGTKIVRIRKTSPVRVGGGEAEALAMVLRTGMYPFRQNNAHIDASTLQDSILRKVPWFAQCCFPNLLGKLYHSEHKILLLMIYLS
jgi:magnesium-transporting ATPase (P-type)